jgi:ABC-2 type transport system ATP-binding protein
MNYCKNVSKSYKLNNKKNVQAVNNISFNILDSEIFGLIGQNGSGKSTLIKMLSGIIHPDTGKCVLLGKDVGFK